MSEKPKAPPVMASPNVIPMADIMLVLLIIFMVITPLLHPGPPLVMAKAKNTSDMPDAERDDAVVIAITHDGSLYLSPGSQRIDPGAITETVKNLFADRLDKTVYVRSDERAKYGDVVEAVKSVSAAGVERAGLLTEKEVSSARHDAERSSDHGNVIERQ